MQTTESSPASLRKRKKKKGLVRDVKPEEDRASGVAPRARARASPAPVASAPDQATS